MKANLNYLKQSLLMLLLVLFSTTGYSQLTHFDVSADTDSTIYHYNDTISFPAEMVFITVTVDDTADLGTLYVVVYDDTTGVLLTPEIILTKEELIAGELLVDHSIRLQLVLYLPERRYRISVTATNAIDHFLDPVTITYPN